MLPKECLKAFRMFLLPKDFNRLLPKDFKMLLPEACSVSLVLSRKSLNLWGFEVCCLLVCCLVCAGCVCV